jgi:hypothetical protein
MKKTLNEEVARIKSIMGCCKGKVNESEADCINPDSEQGQQMLDMAANEVQELGLDNNDMEYQQQDTAEIADAKKKVAEMLNPILPNATKDQLKMMIKDLKRMKREKRENKKAAQQAPVNEQLQAAAGPWAQVTAFLATVPTGVWIAIGAWLLLRLLRCYVYLILGKISVSCGLDIQRSFLVKLAELVFLDFRNLFETDAVLWNCGGDDY